MNVVHIFCICKYLLEKKIKNILNINVTYLQFEREEFNLNENQQFLWNPWYPAKIQFSWLAMNFQFAAQAVKGQIFF